MADRVASRLLDLRHHRVSSLRSLAPAISVAPEIVDHDLRAFLGERQRMRAPNSRAGAGDDCDLAIEQTHSLLLKRVGKNNSPTYARPARHGSQKPSWPQDIRTSSGSP